MLEITGLRRWAMGGVAMLMLGNSLFAQIVSQNPSIPPGNESLGSAGIARETSESATGSGIRERLEESGVVPYAKYTGEILGGVSGGARQGAIYGGLLDVGVEVDLEKVTRGGWKGGRIFVNAFQIHGPSLTDRYSNELFRASNIDAGDTLRLFEAWIQQTLFEERFSMRAGQLAADGEFAVSEHGALFLNSTFGLPDGIAANAPVPSYPMAAAGIRVEVRPTSHTFLRAAIYDGQADSVDEAGRSLNRYGTRFRLASDEGAFVIGEGGFSTGQLERATVLPGLYTVGAWYHSGETGSGEKAWGAYAMADQTLWQEAPGSAQGASVFARVTYSNPGAAFYDWYADGGLVYTGLLPGRDDDTIGVAAAYGHVADAIGEGQRAAGVAVQKSATVFEVSYQVRLNPWWTLQPDVQYHLHPDGGRAGDRLPDAVILGLRTILSF